MRRHAAGALAALALAALAPASDADVAAPAGAFDAADLALIASLGPWPEAPQRDPSNRVSRSPAAVAFGEWLFHSPRLSSVGGLRCASCHEPWRGLADGRATAFGARAGSRNTIALHDVAGQRWFGWDGASDTLWGQSLRPLLDADEMASSAAHVAQVVRGGAEFSMRYGAAFGRAPPADDDEELLVDVGKALAAYQETLVSARTVFDDFRDALQRGGDAQAVALYPHDARRGLRLFIGVGGCIACHAGPRLRDGAFHRSLVGSARAGGAADPGRVSGHSAWQGSPYRRDGRFSDGLPATPASAADAPAAETQPVAGAFRTPTLRGLARTAPYMHDGSAATLCDAVMPHTPGAASLSRAQRGDIVAFLYTLDEAGAPPLAEGHPAWASRSGRAAPGASHAAMHHCAAQ